VDAFRSDPWGAYLVDEEPGLVLWAPSALVRFRRLLALGSILRILGAAIGGVAGISFGVTLVSVDLSVASGLGALGLVFILGGVAFALMGIGAALQSWARTALPGAARKP
jgi:hypothetical protein